MKRISKRGFTLIELLAVVTIIGILMMLAIPSVSRTIEKSRKKTFLDIAKTYANSAKNLWTADAVLCGSEYQHASSMVDGNYFLLIDTSSDVITPLTEKDPKSPWGGGDLKGYVRITKEVDGDQATKYYVALTDGRHAIYDDPANPKEAGLLGDKDILQDISQNEELLKAIQEIPFENGKYTTCSEESAIWTGTTPFYIEPNENITINNGDGATVGDEVCIGNECFYVISSDDDKLTLFAKYNLYVGNTCANLLDCRPLDNPTGIQDVTGTALGDYLKSDGSGYAWPWIGSVKFLESDYWYDEYLRVEEEYGTAQYPYVYNSNSLVYPYVENYKNYLISNYGLIVDEARLISLNELEVLGCSRDSNNCNNAPSWVYSSSYWSGSAYSYERMWRVSSLGAIANCEAKIPYAVGVRPVIVIPKALLG